MLKTYQKILTFPNIHLESQYFSSTFRRYYGLLHVQRQEFRVTNWTTPGHTYPVSTSFVEQYPMILSLSTPHLHNPMCVVLCYVIEESEEKSQDVNMDTEEVNDPEEANDPEEVNDPPDGKMAHVREFEIWFDSSRMIQSMETLGTFAHEGALIKLYQYAFRTFCGIDLNAESNVLFADQHYPVLDMPLPSFIPWRNWSLYPHQKKSWNWMRQVEERIQRHEHVLNLEDGVCRIADSGYFYDAKKNIITWYNRPHQYHSPLRGGVLADVTGAGKTLTMLTLILSSLRAGSIFDHSQYLSSSATLIIVPSNLYQQWWYEIQKFFHTHALRIHFITNFSQFRKVTLAQLLQADIVITTDTFLHSARYQDQVNRFANTVYHGSWHNTYDEKSPSDEIIQNVAWRICRFRILQTAATQIPVTTCVPLQMIHWHRVVYDEIAQILEKDSHVKHTLPRFSGQFVWGISGTPMLQNGYLLKRYMELLLENPLPTYWSPHTVRSFITACFHRISNLTFTPVTRTTLLVESTESEKQLLLCCQNDGHDVEKHIQMCTYFNVFNKMPEEKIPLATMEEISEQVQSTRRKKIRQLEQKISSHHNVITDLTQKLEQTVRTNVSKPTTIPSSSTVTSMVVTEEPLVDYVPTDEVLSVFSIRSAPLIPLLPVDDEMDARDLRDRWKARKKRLDRLKQRHRQLIHEKETLERSLRYFDQQVSHLHSTHQCPICYQEQTNVIAPCGHSFCRTCLVQCLREKSECPFCKKPLQHEDVYEIVWSDSTQNCWTQKYGSKLIQLCTLIEKIVQNGEKVVVYIEWLNLIHMVKKLFEEKHYAAVFMIGNALCQNAAIKKFKTDPTVTILVGPVSNTGLDLSEANHLIFTHVLVGADQYEIEAKEEQIEARIRRINQTKPTFIYHLIVKDSLEEKLYGQSRKKSG